MQLKGQQPLLIILLLILVGTGLRFYNLGTHSLWHDEAVTWQIANNSIIEVITQNALQNSAPPTYVLLLRSIISILGDSEFVLRLLSAIFGVAGIPAVYALSRQFLSAPLSYFVAALVTVVYSMVKYSQEVREYSLTFLLATLLLMTFIQFLQNPTWKKTILLTLLMVASVFVQYGLSLLIFALNIIVLIEWIRSKSKLPNYVPKWIVSQMAVLVAVIIVYNVSLNEHMGGTPGISYLEDSYWNGSLSGLFNLLVLNTRDLISFAYLPTFTIVSRGLLLFLVAGLWQVVYKDKNTRVLLLIGIPIIVVMITAILQIYPYGGIRQLVFLLPMIYILIGYSFKWITETIRYKWVPVLLGVVILYSGLLVTVGEITDTGDEYLPPLIAALYEEFKEGDRIYVYESSIPALSYYERRYQSNWIIGVGGRGDPNLETHLAQIDTLLQDNERLWLFFANCYEEVCDRIPAYITQQHQIHLIGETKGSELYLVP